MRTRAVRGHFGLQARNESSGMKCYCSVRFMWSMGTDEGRYQRRVSQWLCSRWEPGEHIEPPEGIEACPIEQQCVHVLRPTTTSVSESGPYRPSGGAEEMQGGGRRVRLDWGTYITV
ncbi:hypothetical protein FHG87_020210 [Trinorchestia longiramus]|nr:hypothetical protein FHG87_020210 [Trinorchestia longiramus]